MKALHGIYQNGQIDFLFAFPDTPGPINVLVVFPDPEPLDPYEEVFNWDDREEPDGKNASKRRSDLSPWEFP